MFSVSDSHGIKQIIFHKDKKKNKCMPSIKIMNSEEIHLWLSRPEGFEQKDISLFLFVVHLLLISPN